MEGNPNSQTCQTQQPLILNHTLSMYMGGLKELCTDELQNATVCKVCSCGTVKIEKMYYILLDSFWEMLSTS